MKDKLFSVLVRLLSLTVLGIAMWYEHLHDLDRATTRLTLAVVLWIAAEMRNR
jgi:hypothetical protein